MDFPFIDDTNFPNVGNVNTYKYKNEFDYSKFDNTQMTIELLNVPWDLGSVHIGLKEITGFGRVVKFETTDERNEWFNNQSDKYTFETKYRRYHTNDEIKLPIPYDVVLRYNYVRIKYSDMSVNYENAHGVKEFYYFIRNAEMLSPNTTLCTIALDAWQTYIYDLTIENVLLEQGHYPVSKTNVDNYLSDPINNNALLLSDDVNYGDINRVKNTDVTVFNSGDMYALIATTAKPQDNWGSKNGSNWTTPASSYYTIQGVPNVYTFATKAENVNQLLKNIESDIPQFKQTIQALYFVSEKLLNIGSSFSFAGITCFIVGATQKTIKNLNINKSMFGYDEKYSHLAKLYTSPYSHIEIVSDSGKTLVVNIEDTNGTIEIKGALSLAYPYLKIDSLISSVGGNSGNVTFKNITSNSFSFGGRWYEYLNSWDVPTFAVVQSNKKTNDYLTYYDRVQSANEYNTNYTNADNSASNTTANNAVTVSASSATTANTVSANSTGAGYTNAKLRTDTQYDIGNSNAAFDAERDQLAVASTNNDAQAVASTVNTVASVAGSVASMDIGGAVSSAITGGVSTGVNWQTANASITVSQSNNTAVYNQAVTSAYGKQDSAIAFTNNSTALNNSTLTSNTNVANNASTSIASNNASLMRSNALNVKNTAIEAVNNGVKSANIKAPNTYGTFANGDTATTRPQALFTNVVTQSDNAIKQTGDYFLRYGYMLNQYIDFETFNVMPKFSYWKCSDIWTTGFTIPDEIADQIRFYLLSGVYVFRKPEYITERNVIYNNK